MTSQTTDAARPEERDVRFRNYVPKSEKLLSKLPGGGSGGKARGEEEPKTSKRARTDGRKEGDAARRTRDDDDDDDDDVSRRRRQDDKDAFALELERLQAAGEDGGKITIVPKSPTWDLKRDLEPRLAALAKRTQRAVVDIIRARLAGAPDDEAEDDIEASASRRRGG